jgi:predicted site-specific integrase-resolvase
MELYRVSYGTAARWVDSGRLDECIARHVEREQRKVG